MFNSRIDNQSPHVASSVKVSATSDTDGAEKICQIPPTTSELIKAKGAMRRVPNLRKSQQLVDKGVKRADGLPTKPSSLASTEKTEAKPTLSGSTTLPGSTTAEKTAETQGAKLQTSPAMPSEIDLSKEDVLFAKAEEAIGFVLNPENAGKISRFFIGKSKNPIDEIARNPDLQNKLREIKTELEAIRSQSGLTDEAHLEELGKLRLLLQEANNLIKEGKIDGVFPQFIQGVAEFINVSIVNRVAEETLQRLKPKIEEKLRNASDVISLSLGVFAHSPKTAGSPGAYAGGGVHATLTADHGKNTLFKTDIEAGISVSAGFGSKLDSGLRAKMELNAIFTTMYASVEQFIDFEGLADFEGFMFKAKKHLVGTLNDHGSVKAIASQALFIDSDLKNMEEEASSARHELQSAERKGLLATGDIENFLRMTGMISHDIHVERSHITKTAPPMTKTSIQAKATLSAELSDVFNKMGLEVSASGTHSTVKAPRHYLALLNSDCSPNANLTAEEVKTAIDTHKDYDRSGVYVTDSEKVAAASVAILSSHLKDYNSVLQSLAKCENKKSDIGQLEGDIKQLKKNMEQLKKSQKKKKVGQEESINQSKKQLEKLSKQLEELKKEYKEEKPARDELRARKKAYESQLSPKSFIRSEGRLGVLKSCIVTVAKLREHIKGEEGLHACEKMFQELKTLESLLEFSKNKDSRSGTVMQKTESGSISGEISGMAHIGDCSVSVRGNECSGSPFLSENGKFLSLEVSVPLSSFDDLKAVGDWVKGGRTKLKEDGKSPAEEPLLSEENPDGSDHGGSMAVTIAKSAIKGPIANIIADVSHAKNVVSDVADGIGPLPPAKPGLMEDVAGRIGMDGVLKQAGEVVGITSREAPHRKVKAQLTYVEPNRSKAGEVRALPGKKSPILRDAPTWVTQYTESLSTKSSEKTVTVGGPVGSVKGGMSGETQVGDTVQTFGTDTASHIISEFDRAERGDLGTWNTLIETHPEELAEMFRNLAKSDSGILYELQGLYNANLKNVSGDAKTECAKLFKELLDNCDGFSRGEIDPQVALKSLEKVLKFNYDHSSSVHFNQAFDLKKKSKSKH
ncbi:MAG: hypothetical protein LBJ13_01805 [Puniceicoccales bacterium]|jgi:hypothetical protein|nr:hypothetical protein [Puniceicoccales bacterium]